MLTVVLQGQITPWTSEYARKYAEFACVKEIILSTWISENVSNDIQAVSQVILSPKPENPGMGNRNMQIVSSAAGCKAALTHWVLKVRTDTFLPQLDDMYGFAMEKQTDPAQLFCLNVFPTYAYHPNDWFFLGHYRTINKLFDIPLDPVEKSGVEDEAYWSDKVRSETYLGVHYVGKADLLKNPRQYLMDISPERERIVGAWREEIRARRSFVPMPMFPVVCDKHYKNGFPHNLLRSIYGCVNWEHLDLF